MAPPWNLPAATDTAQPVAGSCSSRSKWLYRKAFLILSEKLGDRLHTKTDSEIKLAVHQRLDALPLAILESEIQVSMDVAR